MKMQVDQSSIEKLDLEHEFGHLMPWLWQNEPVRENVDEAGVRREVEQLLRTRFGEPAMWQIVRGLNQLIAQGNAEGRFRFRLFPEPVFLREKRWCTVSPAIENLAAGIASVRATLLTAVVHSVEADTVPTEYIRPLLLLTLTSDDGWTSESLLRTGIAQGVPRVIGRRPFLVLPAEHTAHAECIPVSYSTSRVLARLFDRKGIRSEGRVDLRALYGRACTWIRRQSLLGEDARGAMPDNLRSYLSALRFDAATSGIPAIGYARSKRQASSGLPEGTVVRVVSGCPLAEADADAEKTKSAEDGSRTRTRGCVNAYAAGPLDARVRRILYDWRHRHPTRERAAVAGEIAAAMDQECAWSHEYLLASWAHGLIAGKAAGGRCKPGSVHTYYTAVSGILRGHLDHAPSDLTDTVALQEFYDEVAASEAPSKRPSVWRRVSAYHDFLVRHHGAARVSFATFVGQGVDNNLVTPAEYRRARALLDGGQASPRLMQCARIMLVLGYRTGLRFDEARLLEIQQVEDAAAPWIHITPNRWHASLKGDSRKLPLGALLTEDERTELIAMRRQRLAEVGGDETAALIAGNPHESKPVAAKQVRGWLRSAIIRSTGDPDTRYHHLRHGCATWTLFRMLRPLIDDRLLQGVATFEDPELSVEAGQAFRDKMLLQDPGQEALWLTSHILGHASPETTRTTYLHLFEWIGLCESWSGRALDPAALRYLLGLQRSRGYEVHARWGHNFARRATSDWPNSAKTKLAVRTAPASPIEFQVTPKSREVGEMYGLCYASQQVADGTTPSASASGIAAMAQRYGLDTFTLRRFCDALDVVYRNVRTQKNYPRFSYHVDIPRAQSEQADLEEWGGNTFATLQDKTRQSHCQISRVLKLARASFCQGRCSMRIHSPRAGRRLLAYLEHAVGVPHKRFLVLTVPVVGESKSGWQRRRRRLARRLGCPTRRVISRPGAPGQNQAPGTIEISVLGAEAVPSHHSRRGSQAFRSLVHYALVREAMGEPVGCTSANSGPKSGLPQEG